MCLSYFYLWRTIQKEYCFSKFCRIEIDLKPKLTIFFCESCWGGSVSVLSMEKVYILWVSFLSSYAFFTAGWLLFGYQLSTYRKFKFNCLGVQWKISWDLFTEVWHNRDFVYWQSCEVVLSSKLLINVRLHFRIT
jgi:hypothetical protein